MFKFSKISPTTLIFVCKEEENWKLAARWTFSTTFTTLNKLKRTEIIQLESPPSLENQNQMHLKQTNIIFALLRKTKKNNT